MNPIEATVWRCGECQMISHSRDHAEACCRCYHDGCIEQRESTWIYCTAHRAAKASEQREKALAAPEAPADYAGQVYVPVLDAFFEDRGEAAEAVWAITDGPIDWPTVIAHPCRRETIDLDLAGMVEEEWVAHAGHVYDDRIEVSKGLRADLDVLSVRVNAQCPGVYRPVESHRVVLSTPEEARHGS